jgi:hypothetical protein
VRGTARAIGASKSRLVTHLVFAPSQISTQTQVYPTQSSFLGGRTLNLCFLCLPHLLSQLSQLSHVASHADNSCDQRQRERHPFYDTMESALPNNRYGSQASREAERRCSGSPRDGSPYDAIYIRRWSGIPYAKPQLRRG